MTDPEWVTIDEAAELTRTSRATVWRVIRRHDLDTRKYSGQRNTHVRRHEILAATRQAA